MIKKILIDEQGNKYYWISGDLHTKLGKVAEKDILKGGKVTSHLKKRFTVIDATFADATEKIERGPAVISKKDIGTIITTTGINHESKIVDIGTGSGMLALHLANISKNVTSYEKTKEFADIAKKNAEKCDVEITIKNKDIMEGIDEKNADVITVDLKEPWVILNFMETSLKPGGFCVAYLPHITQVQRLCVEAMKMNFYIQKISETNEREWMVDELKARPHNVGIQHTGFLVFLRRI
ncbi:MAG: rRNA adenine N-6-methyltransferase family protein [Nanoarchaeota archaeon]